VEPTVTETRPTTERIQPDVDGCYRRFFLNVFRDPVALAVTSTRRAPRVYCSKVLQDSICRLTP
jgi:hypothetical protein